MKKIWLVEFPTYQYKEDVKALAAAKNLRIIDAKFGAGIGEQFIEIKPPKLTNLVEEAKLEVEVKLKSKITVQIYSLLNCGLFCLC